MLNVDEALRLVLQHAAALPARTVSLPAALGLMLAEEVESDIDSPPHDKALVDGYAVIAADLQAEAAELEVLEEVTAGMTPSLPIRAGQATRLMTGAPIPPGADAVVMIERSQIVAAADGRERVRIRAERVAAGQNIMRRAASLRQGEVVLTRGTEIRPIEIGVLAEVGRTQVAAVPRPRVAVLPTGNELVAVDERPAAGQIRNSNGPMLLAAVERSAGEAIDLGIGRDDVGQLRERISAGLAADVLIISGGVSAGVLDLVPGVLRELGVREVFHKVRLKPGKPLWFGIHEHDGARTLVFGLPGNPVSSLVCFELFVRPSLAALAGRPAAELPRVSARLTVGHDHQGDRPTYHPARLRQDVEGPAVEPLNWKGSGDLRTLVLANALICFPAGNRSYRSGDTVEALRL